MDLVGRPDSLSAVATIAALKAIPAPAATTTFDVIVEGYYAANDGGGGLFRWNGSDATADNGGTIIAPTSGSGRWNRLVDGSDYDVKWFGAKGDDSTNNATTLQACATYVSGLTRGFVFISAGIFRLSGSISLGGSGVGIRGVSQNASILKNTSAANATIIITSGSNNITLQDLTLDRTAVATAGGDGIQFGITSGAEGFVFRIYSKNNYIGISLGGAGYSLCQDCFCEKNINDGVRMTNSNALSGMQWYCSNILCQLNGGAGFRIFSIATTGSAGTGSLIGLRSFGNSLQGFIATGSALCPVQSIRIEDGFFGQDGGDEIYLDTYGVNHYISTCFIELGGTGTTGPAYTTPATGASYGINLTANNNDVMVTTTIINGQSYSGIASSTPFLKIIGGQITNNGQSATAGAAFQAGVYIAAGVCEMVDVTCKNTGGAFQKYGFLR
jgi:hypothetical protein